MSIPTFLTFFHRLLESKQPVSCTTLHDSNFSKVFMSIEGIRSYAALHDFNFPYVFSSIGGIGSPLPFAIPTFLTFFHRLLESGDAGSSVASQDSNFPHVFEAKGEIESFAAHFNNEDIKRTAPLAPSHIKHLCSFFNDRKQVCEYAVSCLLYVS